MPLVYGQRRPRLSPLRQARWVSGASAIWTLLASTAAVAVGLAQASLALVAFGAVGIFDFASDTVLVVHFRRMHRNVSAAHLERIAIGIVAAGLFAVGLVSVIYSFVHLAEHHEPDSNMVSVGLAAVSVLALGALTIGKLHAAARLPSLALRADAQLTGIGAVLAAITVVGLSADTAFEWWWADPVAALVIGIVAVALAAITARHQVDPN